MRNPKRLISHYTTSKRDNQYKFVNAKLIFKIKLLIRVCEWLQSRLILHHLITDGSTVSDGKTQYHSCLLSGLAAIRNGELR